MTIDCGICVLRPWKEQDIETLAAIADDWEIARFMGDRFPHPYTLVQARAWVERNAGVTPVEHFAVEVDGNLAGAIGFERRALEFRRTFHIGYWIARSFGGRGIATAACRGLSQHAFSTTDVLRLETHVYAPNFASTRVLEKCGYVREGVMRSAVTKGEQTYDAYLYAKVRE